MAAGEPSGEELERLKSEWAAQLEALVGEKVRAFGFFGYLGFLQQAGGRTQIERQTRGLGAIVSWFRGRRKAGGLPTQVCLAVTDSRVLAVGYKAGIGGVAPHKVLRSWDRGVTRVEVEDRRPGAGEKTGARVTLHDPGRRRPVQLESYDLGHDVNDAVLAILRG